MKGAIYTQASFVIKKAMGRTLFSRAPTGGTFQSIAVLDFNLAEDQVYQQAGVNFYLAEAGETGNFVAMDGQRLAPTAVTQFTSFSAVHNIVTVKIGDAWVIANGGGPPLLVENNRRIRRIGIAPPQEVFSLSDSATITELRPTKSAAPDTTSFSREAFAGGKAHFINIDDAFDIDADSKDSFAQIVIKFRDPGGVEGLAHIQYSFTHDENITNLFLTSDISFNSLTGAGNNRSYGTPRIQVSTNSGVSFGTIWEGDIARHNRLSVQLPIDSTNAKRVQIRYVLDNNGASGPSRYNIYGITLDAGGAAGLFSTKNLGFRYVYTYIRKYNRTFQTADGTLIPLVAGIESDPSDPVPDFSVDPRTFTTTSGVTLSFENTDTVDVTHRGIYRNSDSVTIEQSRTIDEYFKIGEIPISSRTFFDKIDDLGFPVDFIGGVEHPPFLVIGGQVRSSNLPPPFKTSVVGSFGGSILYAADDDDGIFYWSRPLPAGSPDYVPPNYSDLVPGKVTAFADVGISLVFTPRSVHAYSFFPLASDAGFFPGRVKVPISTTHGCISKQGATVFQSAQGQQLAAFVAGDGIYITDGSRLTEISKGLDWKNTVGVDTLSSSQLHNDPANKKLLFVYKDNDGTTQKIDVNYEDNFKFAGPQRWPDNSGGVLIQNDGMIRIYSEESGVVYLEESGVIDNARLENSLGTITWEIESPQIYPFRPGGKGTLKSVFVDIDKQIESDIEVTVFYRIDTGGEKEKMNKFTLKTDGWKEAVAVNKQCESFRVVMKSTSPNFPGLNAWTASTDQTDDIFLTRSTEPAA